MIINGLGFINITDAMKKMQAEAEAGQKALQQQQQQAAAESSGAAYVLPIALAGVGLALVLSRRSPRRSPPRRKRK